jgi:peptide chain release factor 1
MFFRTEEFQRRLEELDRQLMDPAINSNPARLREVAQEHADISHMVELSLEIQKCQQELEDLGELLADPDMREAAEEEKTRLSEYIPKLEQQLKLLMLPKDPYEGRNIMLEIRAGTGGDEAAIFAGDLFRMYARYAMKKGWKVELMSTSESGTGGDASGFKEVSAMITGTDVYSHLKFEGGVHRVQRVPVTETQGRIHTSAATVAVLPEADEVEVKIAEKDLRVDVFRAGGPGGQSVNTTDSAVRLTHLPSGLVVICQDEKSQLKNKAKALKVLAARLLERQRSEQAAAEAADRRSQVGSGDRSERIRTYNFPQNRMTDHRIGLTLYKLDQIVNGELDEVILPLIACHQEELLKAQDPHA